MKPEMVPRRATIELKITRSLYLCIVTSLVAYQVPHHLHADNNPVQHYFQIF